MGLLFLQAFGEKDQVLVEEIAKLHKVDVEIVKREYEEMLKRVKDSLQDRD